MVFCNQKIVSFGKLLKEVTILILIDGFLQYNWYNIKTLYWYGHNPYFNRWFSAILIIGLKYVALSYSHNPYFNRWFSAIYKTDYLTVDCLIKSQSLF